MRDKIVTMLILLTIAFGKAIAGGFQINEHSARAMGMGGAFTAIADDPSAAFFNAAGITQLNGLNFMVGTTLIAPKASFRGVSPAITEYKMVDQTFFPSHLYATYKVNKDLAVGFAFNTPFGLGTKWNPDWIGKYLAVKTELMTFTLSPVVAYKLTDNLSLSAGFVYSFANVTITRKNPQTPFEGDAFVDLTGKDNAAFGYNFGLLFKPVEELSFGVAFHSEIKYSFEGTAVTTGAPQLSSNLPNGDISAELNTPVNLTVGVAYQVIPELRLSADYQYVGWSSYDTLKVVFKDPKFGSSASPRLYDNSYILRFGAEYMLSEKLSLLGGILFDKNPVSTQYVNPSLPEADRLEFSGGVNYHLSNKMQVGLSYMFIRGKQLDVTDSKENYTSGYAPFDGVYNSSASLLAFSLSYNF